ncbi:MAG: DinB family protein, partial [Bacilli bacterium]
VPTFSDGWEPPSPPTWRWLFQHVYTHEAYHVGQISVIARLIGIKPPHY